MARGKTFGPFFINEKGRFRKIMKMSINGKYNKKLKGGIGEYLRLNYTKADENFCLFK